MNPKDLEILSAYLDNALEARERSRLETRLMREPDLRAELDSLARTRRILRAAPQMRAPRNFTLTPAMAGAARPARSWLYPATRLAFMLSTFLFAVSLVGNYTFRPQTVMGPEAAAFAVEEAPPAEAMAAESTAPAGDAEPAPEEGSLSMESMPIEEDGAADAASAAGDTGPAPEEEMQSMAPPDESEAIVGDEPPAGSIEETERTMEAAADAQAPEPGADAAGKQPSGEAQEVALAEPEIIPGLAVDPWLLAAAAAGAAALLTGVLMIFLRRRA